MTRIVTHHRTTLIVLLTALLPLAPSANGQLYKWKDAHGQVHFGDRPPVKARTERLQIVARRPWRRVLVEAVTDGDTFRIATGEKIRLLNINAPEIPARGRPGDRLGQEAHRKLESLILGQPIRIKSGEKKRDKYRRHLAYAKTINGDDVTQMMLAAGMGYLDVRAPNTANWRDYQAAEAIARQEGRGIWSLADNRVHAVSELSDRQNRFTRLRAKVQQIHSIGDEYRLNLGEGFSLIASTENTDLIHWLKQLNEGDEVVIRGKIRQKRGKPVIYLRHLSQIEQ